MYHLDQRKYEAIQLTFKQVRHHGYSVNSTLVFVKTSLRYVDSRNDFSICFLNSVRSRFHTVVSDRDFCLLNNERNVRRVSGVEVFHGDL